MKVGRLLMSIVSVLHLMNLPFNSNCFRGLLNAVSYIEMDF